MERLVRLIGALNQHPTGATLAVLLKAVAPEAAGDEARRRMLSRDIEHLNHLGYDIRNVAEPGTDGVYLMRARDNRLQVHFTPEQRGELLRAAIAAGLEGLGGHLGADGGGRQAPPATADLDLVQRGTTRHCLVRFTYKGEPRVVHPARVHSGPSGWYLAGREDGQDVVKEFVVSRMSEVSLDPPGTAAVVDEPARPSLDPLSWRLDPPTDVVIEVPREHRLLVENLLGEPTGVTEQAGAVRMTYAVTNRAVFRWRVYELGTRVRVVGPEDVRREMLAELESLLAGAS
jgi:predicted DNA-binding transcriptional regulator YafY